MKHISEYLEDHSQFILFHLLEYFSEVLGQGTVGAVRTDRGLGPVPN